MSKFKDFEHHEHVNRMLLWSKSSYTKKIVNGKEIYEDSNAQNRYESLFQ